MAKRWARGSTVWKEEGQEGGKDSPQVDTIAKSHQVQVSRCFYAPCKRDRELEDEAWEIEREGEKDVVEGDRDRGETERLR